MPLRMFLLALLAPVAAFAQKGTFSSLIAETPNYRIEAFRLPGGEAGNRVTSIVQGPNGFLWFGSHKGLHRYDGHTFITYQKPEGDTLENSSSLAFSYVENLYWDRFDKLWVCTYGGGLFCFDPQKEQFKRYQHDLNNPHSISQDRVMCAAEDAEGNLWFGTEQNGVNRFERKTGRFERFLPDPADPESLSWGTVKNIYLDKQGTLWVATGVVPWFPKNGGLNRYNPATNSFVRYTFEPEDSTSLWANAVHGLLEDSWGNFWVCTAAGLQKMDRGNGRFERMHYHPNKPHAPGTGVREMPGAFSLLEGQRGGLWVGTVSEYDYPSNLLRYGPTTETVEEFPITTGAWHLCESKDGAIWVVGEGPLKITPKEPTYDLTKGEFIADEFRKTSLYRKLGEAQPDSRLLGPLSMTFDPSDETIWIRYVYDARISRDTVHYPILANYDRAAGKTRFYHLKELYLNDLRDRATITYPSIVVILLAGGVAKPRRSWAMPTFGALPAHKITSSILGNLLLRDP